MGSSIQIAQPTIVVMEAIKNPVMTRFLRLRSRNCTLPIDEPIRKQMPRIISHVRLMVFGPNPENGTIRTRTHRSVFAIVTHDSPHLVRNSLESLDRARGLRE